MTDAILLPCSFGHFSGQSPSGNCRECNRLAKIRYRERFPNLEREWAKKYYFANKESRLSLAREWAKKNPRKYKENKRRWWDEHPEEMRAYARNRRARKAASTDQHTVADIAEIKVMQGNRCAYCRISFRAAKPQVDHIVPLALGGSNGRSNLQILCKPCNSSKRAKHPTAFAQQRGMLL